MGRADFYSPGDWNVICSMCGRKRKASQVVRNWQGMWRCPEHNEPRQPQDFIRGAQDVQTPPWTQPQAQDNYTVFCSPNNQTAIVGYAVVGCVIVGSINTAFDPNVTI